MLFILPTDARDYKQLLRQKYQIECALPRHGLCSSKLSSQAVEERSHAVNQSQEHAADHAPLPSKWFVWGAVAIVAFYLWAEHRAHLYGALPYLLLLLCPLMHLFHGRGGHQGHGAHRASDERGG